VSGSHRVGVEERSPLWRGWREIFSQWRKRGKGIRKLLERFFIIRSPISLFFIEDVKGELLKLALVRN
jgi:hypothetical protein